MLIYLVFLALLEDQETLEDLDILDKFDILNKVILNEQNLIKYIIKIKAKSSVKVASPYIQIK